MCKSMCNWFTLNKGTWKGLCEFSHVLCLKKNKKKRYMTLWAKYSWQTAVVKLKYKPICVKTNENDRGSWKKKDFLRLFNEVNSSICDVQCAFMNGNYSVNMCLLEKKVGLLKGFGCIYCLDEMTLDWIFGLQLVGSTICITYATKDDDKMCCVTNSLHPPFTSPKTTTVSKERSHYC